MDDKLITNETIQSDARHRASVFIMKNRENDKSPFDKFITGILQFCGGISEFFVQIALFGVFGGIAVWMYENGIEYVYWIFVVILIGIIFYMLMKRKSL